MNRKKPKRFLQKKTRKQKAPQIKKKEAMVELLRKKRDEAERKLFEEHAEAWSWLKGRGADVVEFSRKALRFGMAAAVFAFLAAGYGVSSLGGKKSEEVAGLSVTLDKGDKKLAVRHSLVARLAKFVGNEFDRLDDPKRQKNLGRELSESFGIPVTDEIDGHILPDYHGFIGCEQHLLRYPGDATFYHVETAEEWEKYGTEGMAPNTGAWGYFAPSKEALSDDLVQTEKWYAVCQTFLIPGWSEHWQEYADWYKYRKVIMINCKTGQACVCALGDSGPATWTGKVFGASPEAMWSLGLGTGSRRGEVLMFFVDDPKGRVPLGPIEPREVEYMVRA